MLPVPRFTPTVRKFRPQPVDLKEGLKKVKVGIPQLAANCRAFMLLSRLQYMPVQFAFLAALRWCKERVPCTSCFTGLASILCPHLRAEPNMW